LISPELSHARFIEGRFVVLSSDGGFFEPPNVKMTGYNRSTAVPLRVVIFYASDANTPFFDPVK
jgi:hypothetical protein